MPRHLRSVGGTADEIPLSNRRGIGSKKRPPAFGIDRISVSFLASGYDSDPTSWAQTSTRYAGGPNESTTLSAQIPVGSSS